MTKLPTKSDLSPINFDDAKAAFTADRSSVLQPHLRGVFKRSNCKIVVVRSSLPPCLQDLTGNEVHKWNTERWKQEPEHITMFQVREYRWL